MDIEGNERLDMTLNSVDPKNNRLINTWETHNYNDVNNILAEANKAYLKWKDTDLSFRINCLDDMANLLRENSKEYGTLMAD